MLFRSLTLWQMKFNIVLALWCLIDLAVSYHSGRGALTFLAFAAWTPVCASPLLVRASERNMSAFYTTAVLPEQSGAPSQAGAQRTAGSETGPSPDQELAQGSEPGMQ